MESANLAIIAPEEHPVYSKISRFFRLNMSLLCKSDITMLCHLIRFYPPPEKKIAFLTGKIYFYLSNLFFDLNQNPEQIARDSIDRQLEACGWLVQPKKQLNLAAGLRVAVREYQTDAGPADSRVIQEIESRRSVCYKMEETIAASLQQAEALRQSILKRAFERKLVKNVSHEIA